MIQFIDSARFMARSLSNLVNNFSEGIHKIVDTDMLIENVKFLELHMKHATVFLNTQTLKII